MPDSEVHIVPFSAELAPYFRQLNEDWIRKFFYLEPLDEELLSHPQRFILDEGGFIYFASVEGKIVGTFAFIKQSEAVFELAKMAVDVNYRGRKIGNKMMEFAIDKAKERGIATLILYSNIILKPAIHLYQKYGFQEVPLDNSEYKRSNIKMEKQIL